MSWIQKGADIRGEIGAQGLAGYSVKLNSKGNIVALSAPLNDGSGNSLLETGHTRVYEWTYNKLKKKILLD